MPITLLMEWIVVFIGICGFSGTRSSTCKNGTFFGHCYGNEVCICFNGRLYQTTINQIQKVDVTLLDFSKICSCTISGQSVNCTNPSAFNKIVDQFKLNETLVLTDEKTCGQLLTGDNTTLSSTERHETTSITASNEHTVPNEATGVDMCPCNCEYFDKIEYWSQEANQIKQYNELSQQLAHIKNILKMETKNLTSYRNKKKSVNDKRPSARATGYVGGVILVLILCCIVLLDIVKYYH